MRLTAPPIIASMVATSSINALEFKVQISWLLPWAHDLLTSWSATMAFAKLIDVYIGPACKALCCLRLAAFSFGFGTPWHAGMFCAERRYRCLSFTREAFG